MKRDRAWFLREITPKPEAFSLSEITEATGLSLAVCQRFRSGVRFPYPRHSGSTGVGWGSAEAKIGAALGRARQGRQA